MIYIINFNIITPPYFLCNNICDILCLIGMCLTCILMPIFVMTVILLVLFFVICVITVLIMGDQTHDGPCKAYIIYKYSGLKCSALGMSLEICTWFVIVGVFISLIICLCCCCFYILFTYQEEISKYWKNKINDILLEKVIIEKVESNEVNDYYISESCIICLTQKPNIISLPCKHLSLCKKCYVNNYDKFYKKECIICRNMTTKHLFIE